MPCFTPFFMCEGDEVTVYSDEVTVTVRGDPQICMRQMPMPS